MQKNPPHIPPMYNYFGMLVFNSSKVIPLIFLSISYKFIFVKISIVSNKKQAENFLPVFYLGPNNESITPADTAEPITPATLGPIACISKKFEGFSFCPTV